MRRRPDPAGTKRVLRSLPAWFGIDDAVASYVEKAAVLDSFVVEGDDGTVAAVALYERHFPQSAELALIAVHADHRGTGLGRRLVAAGESALRSDGCRYLEVHTVGPSYDDEGYAETRAFYLALGFSPVHEFHGLEWDGPTLVMIKNL